MLCFYFEGTKFISSTLTSTFFVIFSLKANEGKEHKNALKKRNPREQGHYFVSC